MTWMWLYQVLEWKSMGGWIMDKSSILFKISFYNERGCHSMLWSETIGFVFKKKYWQQSIGWMAENKTKGK